MVNLEWNDRETIKHQINQKNNVFCRLRRSPTSFNYCFSTSVSHQQLKAVHEEVSSSLKQLVHPQHTHTHTYTHTQTDHSTPASHTHARGNNEIVTCHEAHKGRTQSYHEKWTCEWRWNRLEFFPWPILETFHMGCKMFFKPDTL